MGEQLNQGWERAQFTLSFLFKKYPFTNLLCVLICAIKYFVYFQIYMAAGFSNAVARI